jgi:hypothetical protein
MARIIVGSYVVRFPLGGYLSWALQWIVGFQRLGHEVYFVEKSGWPNSCYDPARDVMTDDCTIGLRTLVEHLAPFQLQDRWCYVDARGDYHGLSRAAIEGVFASADLFVDMGTHGTWLNEASRAQARVLVDGDPGYTQMRALSHDEDLGAYDHYYSVGRNLGTAGCTVPTMGLKWRPIFDPVVVDLFPVRPVPAGAPFTTVMAWQSYPSVVYNGTTYGAKAAEFEKFIDLPSRTTVPLALAVGGSRVPGERLASAGWRLENPLETTRSAATFRDFIAASRGEFSVNKNFYVATNSGFFSDRSAAYLASGRPVVMQDTGFSAHLPCGCGLFAVRTVDEAAAAIELVRGDYERQSRGAREIARTCLDSSVVLRAFLTELGVG